MRGLPDASGARLSAERPAGGAWEHQSGGWEMARWPYLRVQLVP